MMEATIILFLLQFLLITSLSLKVSPAKPDAQITVTGLVYCDICSNNSFSRHSYFLPGAEVRIDCKFKAAMASTREEITFSANRTTNRLGVYTLDITSMDGVACADEAAMASSCQASLMWSSSSSCNVPGYRATTEQMAFKSKRSNLCIYGLNALNFRPPKKNLALCGKQ